MENEKKIIKHEVVKRNELSEEYFLKDLLSRCYENKLIDDNFLEKIYVERLKNLQILLKYYTKDNSSSVMVEVAESILKCIDYTIGIYLKQFETTEDILEKLKNESIEYMLKAGNRLIKINLEYSKSLLKRIQRNKLRVGNYSYDDTIDYGISIFFKSYDNFFAAHETPGSIDYQLCVELKDYVGIEYIKNYLERVDLENKFCYNFNISDIKELLKGYDKKSELLLINIFELLMTNCLGLIICNKDPRNLNINDYDREKIKNILKNLSLQELEVELLKAAEKCALILKIEDKTTLKYMDKCVEKIASYIDNALKIDKLENIFISFNKDSEDEIIEYIDKENLSNSEFRKVTEKIRECSYLEEKIVIINDKIKSLADLNDMLDAECLFDDEYDLYFRRLPKMQIVLLSKYIDEYNFRQDWHDKFNEYLNSLSKEEKININKIKERIILE